MRGECLCGGIAFEVLNPPRRLLQCHCSVCRKQSGTASNAALIVPIAQLVWHTGQDLISSFVRSSAFRADFCKCCGSPVPNQIGQTEYAWVPVGLLEDSGPLEISLHFFMNSKASWQTMPSSGVMHEEMPAFADVLAHLHAP
jgi:hypothetical protein